VQPLWGVQDDVRVLPRQGRWANTSTAVNWDSNLVGGGVFPVRHVHAPGRTQSSSNYDGEHRPVR
jgi:hypothetical protein